MKKKLISVVAALMVLTMGTTVFAGSPVPVTDAKAEDGTKVEVAEEYSVPKAAETVVKAVEALDAKATFVAKAELTADREVSKDKPLTVTLSVAGVKAGDRIEVLHWDAENEKWESDSTEVLKVEDGKVTVKFTALSPIAIVKLPAKPAPANPPKPVAPAPTEPTSPKTGAAAGAGVVALLGLAGAAVCKKKDN